jgi:hypothetical protein
MFKLEEWCNLAIPKLLIIRDIRIGLANRIFQMSVIFYLIFNIAYNEAYYELETPNGYVTSMWSETGDLYKTQREFKNNVSPDKFDYCDNTDHNYIFDMPYWYYRNVSCVNLPYSSLYEKGENEFFFMTMFTENNISLRNCDHNNQSINTNQTCLITDRLDGNCICQNYKNYYTVGEEDMNFVFDYKYLTTFQTGSNFHDHNSRAVYTRVFNVNGTLVKVFEKNTNIKFSVGEWLDILNVDLDDFNEATKISEQANDTSMSRPRYRITGLQIIINIECTNLVKTSKIGYGDTVCEIHPYINDGWASKGSHITYEQYPNLNDNIITSKYYDRYRYGLKFKFHITGKMGVFHYDKLISAIINAIVMMGTCATLIILIISNFCCDYTAKLMNESTNDSNLHVDKCKSCITTSPTVSPTTSPTVSPTTSPLSSSSSLETLKSFENNVLTDTLDNITNV